MADFGRAMRAPTCEWLANIIEREYNSFTYS